MHRIRTNFILNTFAQVLRIITPFITTPYVSRVLGVGNVGTFSYSYSIQSYFSLFAVLGTVAYGSREIARIRDDREQTSIVFWEIELLTIFTSMVAILGWCFVIALHPENRILYLLLTAYLIAALLDISWLYTGLELFPFIVARSVIVRLLEVACIFVFVRTKNDLPIYCAIMGGGTLVGNLTLWISLKKNIDVINLKKLNKKRRRDRERQKNKNNQFNYDPDKKANLLELQEKLRAKIESFKTNKGKRTQKKEQKRLQQEKDKQKNQENKEKNEIKNEENKNKKDNKQNKENKENNKNKKIKK